MTHTRETREARRTARRRRPAVGAARPRGDRPVERVEPRPEPPRWSHQDLER